MTFLELILLIVFIYLFFRVFATYLAPWLIRMFLKRIQRKFFDQNPHMEQQSEVRKGKVTVHSMKDTKDNEIPPDLGEYIDFEEVNNNQKPVDE